MEDAYPQKSVWDVMGKPLATMIISLNLIIPTDLVRMKKYGI